MTLWSVVVYLLAPYVFLNLVWRGFRYPAYWHRWPERLGYITPTREEKVIWVHAVSVGEVRSSAALVDALAHRYPRHHILVTTMTPTGADQVRELFGNRVQHAYVPYDFPGSVRRFMDRVAPVFAVIAETEFWPNLFRACRRRGIPLLLVNVRVSQPSLLGYLRVPQTARAMLANANILCAQTRIDSQRLRNLGVDESLIRVTGNLKFDTPIPQALLDEGARLRQDWGLSRPILIAASTHRWEERKVLRAFAMLRRAHPDLLLVVVPRHPERFGGVARLCKRAGYRVVRRSRERGSLSPEVNILVGDSMGELQKLYVAADVAFIGGSLVAKGGQNLLEACAVGVPVIFGPHMFHFEEISAMALDCGAARQVHDPQGLANAVALYLEQPSVLEAASGAARALVAENRGALERTLRSMDEALRRITPELGVMGRGIGEAHGLGRKSSIDS